MSVLTSRHLITAQSARQTDTMYATVCWEETSAGDQFLCTDQQRLFVVLLPCNVIGPVVCLCFKHQLVLVRGYAHISHKKTNTSGKILTCVEPSEGWSLLLGLKSELKSASVTKP